MDAKLDDVPVHVVEHGGGMPVLALHGAGVDHREIAGALEPVFRDRPGYRRIYPDLPGMGRTPLPDWFRGSDDTLDVVLGLIDALAGDEPFAVVGHSFGAYLARAVADRRPERVAGLALICPIGEEAGDVPAHAVLHGSDSVADALSPDEQAQSATTSWCGRPPWWSGSGSTWLRPCPSSTATALGGSPSTGN
ncbi:alpha/beta fold hydrolase [Microbispora sp. NBC_01189]|uniref:alpha/beta fold hydrolase n=1 Tax=Microbispora sp. NBC_01189 TaxID=2903583 RepID=UPI002E140679|nr:alpha/beta fold hydrolase [Microbispora sp. NBC_01189]